MTKIKYYILGTFITVGLLTGAFVLSAPQNAGNIFRNITPEADDTYYNATSSRQWKQTHSDEYCIDNDCIGSWEESGGSNWVINASGQLTPSTTIDVLLPADLTVSGNATTTGQMTVGNNSNYLRSYLLPGSNIPVIEGYSSIYGTNVIATYNSFVIAEKQSLTSNPSLVFLDYSLANNANITYNTTTDVLAFNNANSYTFDNNVDITGYATSTTGLYTQSDGHYGGDLSVDGDVNFDNDLTVDGDSRFNGSVSIYDNTKVYVDSFTEVYDLSSNIDEAGRSIDISANYLHIMNYASTTGQSVYQIYDIIDPDHPRLISPETISGIPSVNNGGGKGVDLQGTYAFLAFDTSTTTDTFRIVDISNPSNPVVVGGEILELSSGIQAVDVSGKYAYCLSGSVIDVVDVSNPFSPNLVSSFNIGVTNAWNIKVYNNYAYIIGRDPDDTDTFRIVDVSDPEDMVVVGGDALDLNEGGWSVDIVGEYAYIAAGGSFTTSTDDKIVILDVTDKTNPVKVGGAFLDVSAASYIRVLDDRAFMTSWNGYLYSVDVSSSTNPVVEYQKYVIDAPLSIGISQNNIFIAFAPVPRNGVCLKSYSMNGLDVPVAVIGQATVGELFVQDELSVGKRLRVEDSFSVGLGGVYSNGSIISTATNTDSYFGGRLGVGTSTPTSTLSVLGDIQAMFDYNDYTIIRGDGAYGGFSFIHDGTHSAQFIADDNDVFLDVYGDFSIRDTINGGNVNLFIEHDNGNLGVNTTTPKYKLTVDGDSLLNGTTTFGNMYNGDYAGNYVSLITHDFGDLGAGANPVPLFTFTNSAVQVPSYAGGFNGGLYIVDDITSDNVMPVLSFSADNLYDIAVGGAIASIEYNTTTDVLSFEDAQSYYFDNIVGVATSTPWAGYELAVSGDGIIDGDFHVTGTSTIDYLWHAYGGFSFATTTITIDSAWAWATTTNGTGDLWTGTEADGFMLDNDVMTFEHPGDFEAIINLTFQGGLNKDFAFRVYDITNEKQVGSIGMMSGNGTNNYVNIAKDVYFKDIKVGDKFRFEMTCATDGSDPTVYHSDFSIKYLHD